jgi:hypothetical protein
MAKTKEIKDVQKQYEEIAAECSKLGVSLSASERNRVSQGGSVRLSAEGQRYKELMALKLAAFTEFQQAKDAAKAQEGVRLAEARSLLEAAGHLPPRAETHQPETILKAD